MKKLSITIILRILLIISFALLAFMQVKATQLSQLFLDKEISYEYYREHDINTGWFTVIFSILITINSYYTNYISKKRNNGRILMKEIVLPEVNLDNDERESEITGKSAKAAFSVIIVATFIMLIIFALVIPYLDNPLPYSVFLIAALPIIGLLTYFITYKVLYSR
ncbi:hypothetical protein [Bacillus sp. FJAT-22090]|uniref:hypothetical protein n=1 Tax=Bacillus sp. FJAT-22090 TaxID=1581038 RepID=UPI0011A4E99C|nr:hypothetical protein [Bacillus sp. FJAT-22090]